MALKTPEQYEESMRKMNFKIYLMGELVENWVDNPIIRPSMNSVKMTYALAQKPEYEDLMTAKSHLTGNKINRFTHLHQSTDDLIKKVKMQRLLGQQTASCFQRCVGMDAMNAVDLEAFGAGIGFIRCTSIGRRSSAFWWQFGNGPSGR